MRKFVQLADDVEADLKGLDQDADDLNRRRLEVKDAARSVVNDHHRIQDRIEEGIAAMRKVVEAAGLPNSRTRTAEELAAIEAEEAAGKIKTGDKTALGEASGNTPEADFPAG